MLSDLRVPVALSSRTGAVRVRRAVPDDLKGLLALLSDDPISAARGDRGGDSDEDTYAAALRSVLQAPMNDLLVVDDAAGRLIGTLQLTVIPGMSRRGSTRLLVEAVRVSSAERSAGIGMAVMRWVMNVAAPSTGATLVQLTSDAARVDAHRFYTRLGFADSHIGFTYSVGS